MIVLVSLIVYIAKRISLFPRFFAWCIPTSICIPLNDFSTCFIIRSSYIIIFYGIYTPTLVLL